MSTFWSKFLHGSASKEEEKVKSKPKDIITYLEGRACEDKHATLNKERICSYCGKLTRRAVVLECRKYIWNDYIKCKETEECSYEFVRWLTREDVQHES